jgi:hypothetical protein
MPNPFTIRIFVPEGDPEGVRIIDRLSSTGIFFAFPRAKWEQVKNRVELGYAGVYLLTGYATPGDDLPTLYVGQADTVRTRIEQHLNSKDFWDRAIVFVTANRINSAHAKWLEHALIKRAAETKRSILDNANNPQEPTISESEKADMRVFLNEIYETLPLVGLMAFETPRVVAEPITDALGPTVGHQKDTVIVPAQKEGFEQVFLGEHAWHAIRISGGMLDKIKFIAAYQTAPISAVTHYAPVERIESYGEENKYKLIFSEPAKSLPDEIPFGDATPGTMQGPRYTNFETLLKAKKVSDLF